ncbi:MAG: cAMP/cGMP-dependent 3',5'-cyclic-AMP/GMP phosphodiesterase, partial [Leptospiraceae bacterium]|nr:cAMP/cGMP-dependent 3',5'-cyclic-AMP/GMP phosphodiesterase [Leptospiraceae bacterium]
SSEYVEGENAFGFPDMKAEIVHFMGGRGLDDHVRFVLFNEENQVRINNITISKNEDSFQLIDSKWERQTDVPGEIGFNIIYDTGARLPEPFEPPLLGITCLGPSTGFDPEENTSGFILWIDHQGIMVDPPVNSTEWLRQANVNPKHINSILLTHCHADHDAGTFQKILEEGKITIYTTETVIHSFIRKYNALTRIPAKELFTLFDFVPVVIGKSYYINGAEFRFNYALHSIPSLSFEFSFEDQSFIYSSDHLNDPEIFKDLYQKGILTDTRYIDLLDFPWHHKIIYHEAGPPPLHTRIDYLNTLPEHIQERVHVYHIPKKNFPDETKLTLCRFGIENTLYPEVTPPKMEGVFRLLDALNNVDIFREFPISKAKDFIQIVEEEHYPRGTRIIEKNTPGDKFFIIMSGNVKVAGMEEEGAPEENSYSKRYGSYEYFGEASLINDTPRSADVFAETDVVALTIDKPHFLNFIRDTNLPARFKRLNEVRKTGTWDVLSNSRFFQATTSAQKTQLELLMIPQDYKSGDVLIEAGRTFDQGFIVKNGTVEVLSKTGELVEELSRGDFSAELYQLQKQAPAGLTFRARTDLEVYAIDRDDLVLYIANNPGVYMSLNHVFGNQ